MTAIKGGFWRRTLSEHKKVRELYNNKVLELGDMACKVTRSYYYEYIYEEMDKNGGGYSISRIKKILNMKQNEIAQREIEQ